MNMGPSLSDPETQGDPLSTHPLPLPPPHTTAVHCSLHPALAHLSLPIGYQPYITLATYTTQMGGNGCVGVFPAPLIIQR